jgi:membrane protease YdiL (CAAX protease family)
MRTKEKIKQKTIIHRFPVLSFFALAMMLGSGIIYLVIKGIIPDELALSSALSASIAGIVMTAFFDGKEGLRLLFGRLFNWRAGLGYWVIAILFITPIVLLGSIFNEFFNGDAFSLTKFTPAFDIMLALIVFFFVAGLGQELGWTGFLIPRLQSRFGALSSSIIRALLTSIWHLPVLFYVQQNPHALPDFPYGIWINQKGFLVAYLVILFMFSLPWSILFTWMFNNTKGSLLLVAILHGSEIWVAFWMMSLGINKDNLENYWGYGILMVLAAFIIVMITGAENLSRRYQRITNTKR